MNRINFTLLFGFILGAARPCLGSEILIPLAPNSGINLGQGFDLNTMKWRERCVLGEEIETAPSDASYEASADISNERNFESLTGSLSAGVTLFGGLASVRAKNSYYSSWADSTYSKGTIFRMSFGTGRWELRDIQPIVNLTPEQLFQNNCGTHMVVRLEIQNELLFFSKFLSKDYSWLEKIRWKIKKKALFGLSKKSWSEEKVRAAEDASGVVKVGVAAKGYFHNLLSGRLVSGYESELTCHFPKIQKCHDFHAYFEETINYVNDSVSNGNVNLMDKDMVSMAVLIPYHEAGPRFKSITKRESENKIFTLNEMRRLYFEMDAQRRDEETLGLPMGSRISLEKKLEDLSDRINKCERMNVCY